MKQCVVLLVFFYGCDFLSACAPNPDEEITTLVAFPHAATPTLIETLKPAET